MWLYLVQTWRPSFDCLVSVPTCSCAQVQPSSVPRSKRKWPCPCALLLWWSQQWHLCKPFPFATLFRKAFAHIFWLNSSTEFNSYLAPSTLGRAWVFLQSSLVTVNTNGPEMHLDDPQLVRLIRIIIFTFFLSSLYILSDDMCLELRLLIPFSEKDRKKHEGFSLHSSGKALSWNRASCVARLIWDRSNVPKGNTPLN